MRKVVEPQCFLFEKLHFYFETRDGVSRRPIAICKSIAIAKPQKAVGLPICATYPTITDQVNRQPPAKFWLALKQTLPPGWNNNCTVATLLRPRSQRNLSHSLQLRRTGSAGGLDRHPVQNCYQILRKSVGI